MPTFSLTDGTTTVQLNSGDYAMLSYPLYAPNGDELAAGTVSESIDMLVSGSTGAAVQTNMRAVESLLETARRRQRTSTGPRVYLSMQLDTDAAAWRSEIIDGRLTGEQSIDQLWRLKVECAILITRRAYWEGAEVELQLSTSNQSAATGGRTIYNHDDSGTGHDNWVQIASTQVTGVLPAPVRVSLTNNVGSAQLYTKLWMATNAYSDPANFTHILEAEAVLSGGTVTADATCSGGNRLDLSLSDGVTATYAWSLPTATLQDAQGRWFRLLARFNDNFGSPTIQPRILNSAAAYVIWQGEPVTVSAEYGSIVDLGLIPLPPGGYDASYGALALGLYCRGAMLSELDYLQLTPTDSYRYVELLGASVANNGIIVDDGIEGRAYVTVSSVNYPIASPRGAPLMLYPGVTQRIFFLHQTLSGGFPASPIANTFSVRVYYRPRRVTI